MNQKRVFTESGSHSLGDSKASRWCSQNPGAGGQSLGRWSVGGGRMHICRGAQDSAPPETSWGKGHSH